MCHQVAPRAFRGMRCRNCLAICDTVRAPSPERRLATAQSGDGYMATVRGRADRSWSAGWSGVPAVGGPGGADESADDDHGVGQGYVGVDDAATSLGADV